MEIEKSEELDSRKYIKSIRELYSDSFGDGKEYEDFYFSNIFQNIRSFGIIKNDLLISTAFISNKVLSFDGFRLKCPLISAVCTRKDFRNRGYAFRLIEFIKETLRKENFLAVYLSPVNENVYKKNSFIPFCYEQEFKIKYGGKNAAVLKEADFDDIPLLLNIYNSFCRYKNAFAFRDGYYFKMILERRHITNSIYLICRDNNCLGYIYTDGIYWDICAKVEDICRVKELDGRIISLPSDSKNSKVSQMLCSLDETKLKKQIPNIERSFANPDNFNFDKY